MYKMRVHPEECCKVCLYFFHNIIPLLLRPVETPPLVFLRVGIPPANSPPIPGKGPTFWLELCSALPPPPPPDGAGVEAFPVDTIGALLSLVVVFLSLAPAWISFNKSFLSPAGLTEPREKEGGEGAPGGGGGGGMILLKLHHIHRNKNMLLLEFICQLVAFAKFTPFVLFIYFEYRFSSLDLNISVSEKLTNLNCFNRIWRSFDRCV